METAARARTIQALNACYQGRQAGTQCRGQAWVHLPATGHWSCQLDSWSRKTVISTEGEELSDLAAGPSHKLEAATPRVREATDWRRRVERTLRRLQHLAELMPRMAMSGEGLQEEAQGNSSKGQDSTGLGCMLQGPWARTQCSGRAWVPLPVTGQ